MELRISASPRRGISGLWASPASPAWEDDVAVQRVQRQTWLRRAPGPEPSDLCSDTTIQREKVLLQPAFFSTFSRILNGEKNSIFSLSEKTQGHFWPKTKSWGNFYLINREEKTQNFVKKTQNMEEKLRIYPQNSTQGSLRLLSGAPQPLKKKPGLQFIFFYIT